MATQDDILGRRCYGPAVRRREYIVRSHHQKPALHLRLLGQRHVHRHLVSVEIRVERSAYQGMYSYSIAFYQDGLECLYSKSMQGRRPIEHYRMVFYDIVEDIPHLQLCLL